MNSGAKGAGTKACFRHWDGGVRNKGGASEDGLEQSLLCKSPAVDFKSLSR